MTSDDASSAPFISNQPKTVYSVRAQAEPGVMPRMMELLARRGLVPDLWQSHRIGPDGQVLQITFTAHDLDQSLANHMAICLRQIVSVDTVVMTRDDMENKLEDETKNALSA